MNKETLDAMLEGWAKAYLTEVYQIGWPKVSVCGRIMSGEARCTKKVSYGFVLTTHDIPDRIKKLAEQINHLNKNHQTILQYEYSAPGDQSAKADKLCISISKYRNRLARARTILMGNV